MSARFPASGTLLIACLAAVAWLPAAAAAAPPVSGEALAHFDPLPARVKAGDEVELAWSELPGETEELELLLSLDDGRTFPVRVTQEMAGVTRRFRWRVPNLPAARARLRLRVGDREREYQGAMSPAFEILGATGVAPELEQVHEGTWWSGFESVGDRAASELAPAGPRATLSTAAGEAVAPPPRAPAVLAPAPEPAALATSPSGSRLATPAESSRSRRFQPLRN